MSGNTLQYAETPDGLSAVHCGTLHMLDEGDRNSGWDIIVNPTTSWVEYNLSGRVPPGTTALLGFYLSINTDPRGILLIRDGASSETNAVRTWSIDNQSAATYILGTVIIIKATNGIFDIREYDSSNEISDFRFVLWGYFI